MTRELIKLEGQYTLTTRDAKTGRVVEQKVFRNKLCNNGMSTLLGQLDTVNSPAPVTPLYCAVGISPAAPLSTDYQLGGEVGRVPIASSATSGTQVITDFFFSTTQGNPPLTPFLINEVGLFLKASSAVNSGQLLSHALVPSGQLKTTSYTLTVEFQLVIVSNT